MEGRSPVAIGTPSGAVWEHLLELGIHDSEAVWCQPRVREVTAGPGVVRM